MEVTGDRSVREIYVDMRPGALTIYGFGLPVSTTDSPRDRAMHRSRCGVS